MDGVPVGIELLVGIGFQEVGAGIAVDNHALIFDDDGADGIAGYRIAALAEVYAAGFVAADFNRAEFHLAAEVLACEVGNVHGDGYGQGVADADAV